MSAPRHAALDGLDRALQDTDLEVEVMLVGGAVMTVPFHHDPPSRRPKCLLADPRRLEQIVASVSGDASLPPDWLRTAARAAIGAEGVGGAGWVGARLSVFAPLPEYVFALKCAQLSLADAPDALRSLEADLRYLMRMMELYTVEAALEAVHVFFTPRQLPYDLAACLSRLLE